MPCVAPKKISKRGQCLVWLNKIKRSQKEINALYGFKRRSRKEVNALYGFKRRSRKEVNDLTQSGCLFVAFLNWHNLTKRVATCLAYL
jgi:hypothetical protein